MVPTLDQRVRLVCPECGVGMLSVSSKNTALPKRHECIYCHRGCGYSERYVDGMMVYRLWPCGRRDGFDRIEPPIGRVSFMSRIRFVRAVIRSTWFRWRCKYRRWRV